MQKRTHFITDVIEEVTRGKHVTFKGKTHPPQTVGGSISYDR